MEKHYEELDLFAGYTIEKAVNELLQYRAKGKMVKVKFNEVMLYSDTVTMDDAYLQIVGKTKAQHDDSVEEQQLKDKQELKDHEEKIPELTEHWITKGNEVLSEDRHQRWADCVPIRLGDLYRGMELGCCLDIVKILNDGGTLEAAKAEIEKQGHSGMSFGLVCAMVNTFADRGKEFAEYVNQ